MKTACGFAREYVNKLGIRNNTIDLASLRAPFGQMQLHILPTAAWLRVLIFQLPSCIPRMRTLTIWREFGRYRATNFSTRQVSERSTSSRLTIPLEIIGKFLQCVTLDWKSVTHGQISLFETVLGKLFQRITVFKIEEDKRMALILKKTENEMFQVKQFGYLSFSI